MLSAHEQGAVCLDKKICVFEEDYTYHASLLVMFNDRLLVKGREKIDTCLEGLHTIMSCFSLNVTHNRLEIDLCERKLYEVPLGH